MNPPLLKFTAEDSARANRLWKATCGPHSIAAATGKTLGEIGAAMNDAGLNYRGWMSPTQVSKTLEWLKIPHTLTKGLKTMEPCNGISRVQWEGKWLNPGMPARIAYFHTHLIAHFDGWVLCTACLNAQWIPIKNWRHFLLETAPIDLFHITHHWTFTE
jgi:hypothetical protein